MRAALNWRGQSQCSAANIFVTLPKSIEQAQKAYLDPPALPERNTIVHVMYVTFRDTQTIQNNDNQLQ